MSPLPLSRGTHLRNNLFYAARIGMDPGELARFASGTVRPATAVDRLLRGWDKWEPAPDLSVHTVCCHRDTPMAVWTLASLVAALRRRVTVQIHDDGSLTEADRYRLADHLPVEFVPKVSPEDIHEALADYPVAASFRVRHEHRWTRKLMDPVLLSNEKHVLLVDTDVAWFGPSPEIDAWLARPTDPIFWHTRWRTPFVFKGGEELDERLGSVNSGVALFRREDYDFNRLEEFCNRIGPQIGMDQPGYAWVFRDRDFTPLDPARYPIAQRSGPDTVARHYTGPRRQEFWAEGVHRIARSAGSVSPVTSAKTVPRAVLSSIAPRYTGRGRFVRRMMRGDLDAKAKRVRAIVEDYAASHPEVVFVQIGSNDGETRDPLADYIDRHDGWSGVFVEPIPGPYSKVASKRSDRDRFRVVQAAITDRDGTVEMTTVDPEGEGPYVPDRLSSLNDSVIMNHAAKVPHLVDRLQRVSVPAMTFETLTDGMTKIDLILIDTEGHDAVVLDQIDFDRWQPELVMYEHKHLAKEDQRRCRQRLQKAGYVTTSSGDDTVAVRR